MLCEGGYGIVNVPTTGGWRETDKDRNVPTGLCRQLGNRCFFLGRQSGRAALASSTMCGKSRSFICPVISDLRRFICPCPPLLPASRRSALLPDISWPACGRVHERRVCEGSVRWVFLARSYGQRACAQH